MSEDEKKAKPEDFGFVDFEVELEKPHESEEEEWTEANINSIFGEEVTASVRKSFCKIDKSITSEILTDKEAQGLGVWDIIKKDFVNIKNRLIFNHNLFSSQKELELPTMSAIETREKEREADKFEFSSSEAEDTNGFTEIKKKTNFALNSDEIFKIGDLKGYVDNKENDFEIDSAEDLDGVDESERIYIFAKAYSKFSRNLLFALENVPWLCYRKNFDMILCKDTDTVFTSDAGWGCMIRATQMMVAQGLYRNYACASLKDFITKYGALFYDNSICRKYIVPEKPEEFTMEEKEHFVIVEEPFIRGFEHTVLRKKDAENVVPPLSLRAFFNAQTKFGLVYKNPGKWFSNVETIKIYEKIINHLSDEERKDMDFRVYHYDERSVYIETILKECFEAVACACKSEKECHCFDKTYKFDDGKRYKMKKKILIFIAGRKGLYQIEQQMFEPILDFFEIKTNIGLIGGTKNRAFYFFGKCGSNLIYIDPHFVKDTPSVTDWKNPEIYKEFKPLNIYYVPIKDVDASFTIGFAIKNEAEFDDFIKSLEERKYILHDPSESQKKEINYLFSIYKHKEAVDMDIMLSSQIQLDYISSK